MCQKDDTYTYLKLEIHGVWREFLAFKYVFIVFLKKSDAKLYIAYNKFLTPTFQTCSHDTKKKYKFLKHQLNLYHLKRIKIFY